MKSAGWAKALLPLLLFTQGSNPPGREVLPLAPARDSTPTARVCALHDYGTPRTDFPRRSDDPLWHPQINLLVEGPDSAIYTTSPSGGKDNRGRGVIYKISPIDGKVTLLYNYDGAMGAGPRGGLTTGRKPDGSFNGYFYGTTYGGGSSKVGTVFRIAPGATRPDTLYNFRNGGMGGVVPPRCPTWPRCPYSPQELVDAAGAYPTSAPVMAADGNLYGITSYSWNQGFGVLYRLPPSGGPRSLRGLCVFDQRQARKPDMAPLVCNSKGFGGSSVIAGDGGRVLYGTTTGGHGTVFKATLGGAVTTLHEFNLADGSKPFSILQGRDGNLYGTTWAGGPIGAGVVFRLNPNTGEFTILTSFPAYRGFWPGATPIGGLVEKVDTSLYDPTRVDTNLYGATKFGGRERRGALYRIRTDGTGFKVVHSFPWQWNVNGRSPLGTPLLHSNGFIYGTTFQGGTYDKGVFYRLSGMNLRDLPNLTVAPKFTAPPAAPGSGGTALRDNLVEVRTGVGAWQTFKPGTRTPDYVGTDGIRIDVRSCRNAHVVQFIWREEIMATNPPTWREGRRDQGYDLTTNPADPKWDTDVGRAGPPNPFFDQVPHNPRLVGPFSLTVWDQPSMDATDPTKLGVAEDTRRAHFRSYLFCNCELVRLVTWTREEVGSSSPKYTGLSLRNTTDADLAWVNQRLKEQKFIPVP